MSSERMRAKSTLGTRISSLETAAENSAKGNLSGDVARLESRVSQLEGVTGDLSSFNWRLEQEYPSMDERYVLAGGGGGGSGTFISDWDTATAPWTNYWSYAGGTINGPVSGKWLIGYTTVFGDWPAFGSNTRIIQTAHVAGSVGEVWRREYNPQSQTFGAWTQIPPGAHTHDAADVTSGTFNISRIPNISNQSSTGRAYIGTNPSNPTASDSNFIALSPDSDTGIAPFRLFRNNSTVLLAVENDGEITGNSKISATRITKDRLHIDRLPYLSRTTSTGRLYMGTDEATPTSSTSTYWALSPATDTSAPGAAWLNVNGSRVLTIDNNGKIPFDSISPSDSGWVNISIATGKEAADTYPPQVRKLNGVVYLRGGFKITGMTASAITIGTIPVGYRPPSGTRYVMRLHALHSDTKSLSATVTSSGVISASVQGGVAPAPAGYEMFFSPESWPAS